MNPSEFTYQRQKLFLARCPIAGPAFLYAPRVLLLAPERTWANLLIVSFWLTCMGLAGSLLHRASIHVRGRMGRRVSPRTGGRRRRPACGGRRSAPSVSFCVSRTLSLGSPP